MDAEIIGIRESQNANDKFRDKSNVNDMSDCNIVTCQSKTISHSPHKYVDLSQEGKKNSEKNFQFSFLVFAKERKNI